MSFLNVAVVERRLPILKTAINLAESSNQFRMINKDCDEISEEAVTNVIEDTDAKKLITTIGKKIQLFEEMKMTGIYSESLKFKPAIRRNMALQKGISVRTFNKYYKDELQKLSIKESNLSDFEIHQKICKRWKSVDTISLKMYEPTPSNFIYSPHELATSRSVSMETFTKFANSYTKKLKEQDKKKRLRPKRIQYLISVQWMILTNTQIKKYETQKMYKIKGPSRLTGYRLYIKENMLKYTQQSTVRPDINAITNETSNTSNKLGNTRNLFKMVATEWKNLPLIQKQEYNKRAAGLSSQQNIYTVNNTHDNIHENMISHTSSLNDTINSNGNTENTASSTISNLFNMVTAGWKSLSIIPKEIHNQSITNLLPNDIHIHNTNVYYNNTIKPINLTNPKHKTRYSKRNTDKSLSYTKFLSSYTIYISEQMPLYTIKYPMLSSRDRMRLVVDKWYDMSSTERQVYINQSLNVSLTTNITTLGIHDIPTV